MSRHFLSEACYKCRGLVIRKHVHDLDQGQSLAVVVIWCLTRHDLALGLWTSITQSS